MAHSNGTNVCSMLSNKLLLLLLPLPLPLNNFIIHMRMLMILNFSSCVCVLLRYFFPAQYQIETSIFGRKANGSTHTSQCSSEVCKLQSQYSEIDNKFCGFFFLFSNTKTTEIFLCSYYSKC